MKTLLLWLAPLTLFAQTPTPVAAPYPGFWHCATAGNFRYCPCYPLPYTKFTDPETGSIGYFRYDFSQTLWSLSSACGLEPQPCIDGQGGPNHTQQAIGGGYVIPLEPQPDVNNYYPVPEAETGLGAIWAQFNQPPPAFPGTNYAQKMKSNPIWVTGYNYKKPAMDADPGCQPQVATRTPTKTPSPTITPTPTRTPTPAPNIYAAWIEAAYNQGYMSACGVNLFCPGDSVQISAGYVSRAQEAVFILKSVHGPSYLPPACVGIFTDVVCK